MSLYCPKDGKVCVDDLCYSGDCLLIPGLEPGARCYGCGMVVFRDNVDCLCPPDDYDDQDDQDATP